MKNPSVVLAVLGLQAWIAAGCETTTKEKNDYVLTDARPDSVLDSRIKKLSDEAVKYPLRSDLHYQIAVIHAKKGDCNESVRALERAIKISPNDAKYYFHLGRLYLNMNDLGRAEEEFRKSIQLTPEGRFTGPHAALAWTMSLRGEHAAALAEFEKCTAIDPANPIFHYFQGSIHDIQGNAEKAIHHFREYLARGGTTYRTRATDMLRRLGVNVAELPEAPARARGEELLGPAFDRTPEPTVAPVVEPKPGQ